MSFKVDGIVTSATSFVKEHKVLTVLTLGLAIVGISGIAKRPVAWLCQRFGTAKKVESLLSQINTQEIEKTVTEATKNRGELKESRKKVITDLQQQKPAHEIAKEFSARMHAFVARLYKEGEKKLGPPPCSYCVAVLGSLGRKESGPYPDYDNFLIMEENTPKTRDYFTRLNQYVADRIVRLGEVRGFRLCDGNLNSPYQKYKSRYSHDKTLNLRGEKELLTTPSDIKVELSKVIDSSPICGDQALYQKFMNLVCQQESSKMMPLNKIKRCVNEVKDSINPSPITASKLPKMIHIKEELFRLPQGVILALAVHFGVTEKNSLERIGQLKNKGVFSPEFAERLAFAVEFLIGLRIQAQAAYGEELEFVSTQCDWDSFSKNNVSLKEKIQKLDDEIQKEEKKSGATFKDFQSSLKDCDKKIKDLESQIDSQVELDKYKKQKTELQAKLKSLGDLYGLKEYYQDLLNPKIAKNQYFAHTNSPQPSIVAFTEKDKSILEKEVLPTLRDLYAMATESIKDGTLNPAAFST